MPAGSNAYNSLWQVRTDAWSALEEATAQLALAGAQQRPVEQLTDAVAGALDVLAPIERFWAFPGMQAFYRVRLLFATGKYHRCASMVARINRTLATDSYRGGPSWDADADDEADEHEVRPADQSRQDRPYFEVLVVEDMTEDQERALREELRRWRRPDDQFLYEIVVVPSFDDAVMAARLNFKLQACVVRRRFTHRSRHDCSSLGQFVSLGECEDLMDHSPDERAQVLARTLAKIRPELDLYLMTEIAVEDLAGLLSHHFRAARTLAETLRLPEYRARHDAQTDEVGAIDAADDDILLNRRLLPDPARARVRVYSTQSTHKTLTSLRQGSMIHVFDQDFSRKVEETFHEAYMTHTSTSPNYQILASLDLGRRQAALEGFELVQKQIENAMRLRDAVDQHPLLSRYMHCLTTADLIPPEYRPSGIDQPLRSGLPNMMTAWDADEFVLDPSRVTIYIGNTGIEGDAFKRSHLMDRYGVQINKTSRNTVLFMTTIGTSRSSVAYLIEVLVTIARELEAQLVDMSPAERAGHERAVLRLTAPSAPLPDFSGFHPSFTDGRGLPTREGDVRRAFYLSYNDNYCEYLMPDEVEQRVEAGDQVVSTSYVTPYPPGFPVLVPGQVFSPQILAFMRSLDTPEVHGYRADLGYRVYVDKALEIAATTRPAPPPDLAAPRPPAQRPAPSRPPRPAPPSGRPVCTDDGPAGLPAPVLHDLEPAFEIDLEPVDSVVVTTLMDNVTDTLMPDLGPAHRIGSAPVRAARQRRW